MPIERLSFADVVPLTENITEFKIDEGVEVTTDMVDEYHAWLCAHHPGEFAVLVNKTNSYSYTFNAQLKIGQLDNMKVSAFLVNDRATEVAIKSLMSIRNRRYIPYRVFYDHDEAVNWLKLQMDIASAS